MISLWNNLQSFLTKYNLFLNTVCNHHFACYIFQVCEAVLPAAVPESGFPENQRSTCATGLNVQSPEKLWGKLEGKEFVYAYVYIECIQYVLVLPCVCSVKVCVLGGGGGGYV